MFEVIAWIIFGLYATAHVVDSIYALYCLSKVKDEILMIKFLMIKFLMCLTLYALTLGISFLMIAVHSPGESSLNRLVVSLVSELIFLPLVIIFNHGCPIDDYKDEKKQAKDIFKQKTIKL